MTLVAQLKKRYGIGGEVPTHPLAKWRRQVLYDDTRLGYWEWVAQAIARGETGNLTKHSFPKEQ